MTEADLIQARFDIGDAVTFREQSGTKAAGFIEKLNLRTATVRHGLSSWRVPYALLELPNGELRNGRVERLREVAREARDLMDRHGLTDWTFRFSAARRTIGLCKEKERVIQLGRHHAANDAPLQVTDTILHEIAHALAGTAARHGPAWRRIALRIGAVPKASKAADPAKDEATRNGLRTGIIISFRTVTGRELKGTVVKLNRKTARVSCGNLTLLVPYGCIAGTPAHSEAGEA